MATIRRPRVLVLHPRIAFLNPTTELWPGLFETVADAVFFGPGYQPRDVLARGLKSFVENQPEPFDLIVVSEHVTNPKGEGGSSERERFLVRTYGYARSEAAFFLSEKKSWLDFVQLSGVPTIYTFFEFDPYRVYPEWTRRMEASPGYLAGWGLDFVRPVGALPGLAREEFAARATDDWFNFLATRSSQILSLPAFVSADEFDFTPLSERPWNWSVLGTNYAARREARAVLTAAKLGDAGIALHRKFAALDRLSRGRIGNKWVRSWARTRFREALAKSKASFTCGSGLEYPIRKFFEIPAAGALLVTPVTDSMRHLGFVEGEHYIAAPPRQMIESVGGLLEHDLPAAQKIAVAGQDLVRRHHSLDARTEQLDHAISRILTDDFTGSRWSSGELVFC